MSCILVVEDHRGLAEGLRSNLEIEGYDVVHCERGDRALEAVRHNRPDLIVLDMMLPEQDGFAVLDELRAQRFDVPVLCLTARGEEVDKVRALRSGADDYMTKPFGLMELLARIEALLRRCGSQETAFEFGAIRIDTRARSVTLDGVPVDLAPREFDLLEALAARPGEVMSRQELMRRAWGHASAVVSRTVDTHVAELRRKLEEDPAHPRHLLTVRKAGYRLVP